MTKQQATFKAHLLLQNRSYEDLAKILDISKPTLYTRLVKNNWKAGEIALLEKH